MERAPTRGFCTDRLSTVFRLGEEPFVAPSGGRADEIVRAVQACPSGALSLAVNGRELREEVDTARPPAIEVSKDGPYRVTGGIPIVNAAGSPMPQNDGASQEHLSLCRCGHSQNKPFCSGMHWYVGFADPPPDPGGSPTLFEWAGGFPALTRMTERFYATHVPDDPVLAPLFATMSPDHPQRVAAWRGEVFGGPERYTETRGGYAQMISQHRDRCLTEDQRARWVTLLCRSADEVGLPADPEFRAAFVSYLEWGSRIALMNSQPGAEPPPRMPVPEVVVGLRHTTPGATPAAAPIGGSDPVEAVLSTPEPGEALSFAKHVRPLFRAKDCRSMSFAFDLWSHEDVAEHGEAILARILAGSMACDGAWPEERTDVLRRWLQEEGSTA